MNRKRVIAVLGMHRSGTSTIAKGLEVLGVDLGDRLHAAGPDNPTGFWEDEDLLQVNIKLLHELGLEWDSFSSLPIGWERSAAYAEARAAAGALLRQRLAGRDVWGFKDPRVLRVLPLWLHVFSDLGIGAEFLFCLRNPLSVAYSIQRRNDLPLVEGILLWLLNVVPNVALLRERRVAFVDYDLLIRDPESEWTRIAREFECPLDAAVLGDYTARFLDQGLQHTAFDAAILKSHPAVVPLCARAFDLLSGLAHGGSLADDQFWREWQEVAAGFANIAPVCERLEAVHRARREHAAAAEWYRQESAAVQADEQQRDQELEQVRHDLTRLRLEFEQGRQALADADDRCREAEKVKEALEHERGEASRLNCEVAQLQRALEALDEANREAAAVKEALEQERQELARLRGQVEQGQQAVQEARGALNDIYGSRLWRMSEPLRWYGRQRKRLGLVASHIGVASRNAGGVLPLARKALGIWREYGLSGLRASGGAFVRRQQAGGWNPQAEPGGAEGGGAAVADPYLGQVLGLPTARHEDYVAFDPPVPRDVDIRLIAFYLPQFHPVPENDAWWGRGFTEWTNVSKAVPQFVGHHQPHLPGELGFYDLRLVEVQQRQIELAKAYGLHGFCYHHYWFGGRRLLERPFQQVLNNPDLDFPFCVCWANENWTRRWDGFDSEILIGQQHSPEDDLAFIRDLEPAFRDPRYIRVDGKPLLVVYRPSLLPDAAATARRWRDYCESAGLGGVFLAMVQFDVEDPRVFGFDAAIEFPPHKLAKNLPPINHELAVVNPVYAGQVMHYDQIVDRSRHWPVPEYPLFRGIFPGWDNEARRPGRGYTFAFSTPERYREWLRFACNYADHHPVAGEKMVFINAWNEWAEGAFLEPDRRFGYAYLQATAEALYRHREVVPVHRPTARQLVLVGHDAHHHGAQLLALNLARTLREHFGFELHILLAGDGKLLPLYAQYGKLYDLAHTYREPAAWRALGGQLRAAGCEAAICNTTVVGAVAEALKDAGLRVVSLVHELPSLIAERGLEAAARGLATRADHVVFPARFVQERFETIAPVPAGRAVIRPQGLYRRLERPAEPARARADLRQELGLPEDCRILLGVGYGDLRKGFDLFVALARQILPRRQDLAFVWIGGRDEALALWLDHDLRTLAVDGRMRIFPMVQNVDAFYAGADLMLLPSREDPFPSVVMESLRMGLPVIAFEGSGGAPELLAGGGGVVVPYLDLGAMEAAVVSLLDDPARLAALSGEAVARTTEGFGFVDYVHDLLALAGHPRPKVSVVVPNFNYARYLEQRLETVFGQSHPVYEVIVLDDCSTDDSLATLDRLREERGWSFEVVANPVNSGSVFAQWAAGVARARGELVWIAEADDFADLDFLERVAGLFADPQLVLGFTQSRQVDGQGRVLCGHYLDYVADVDESRWRHDYIRDGRDEIRECLAVKNTIPNVSAVLFRREALQAVLAEEMERIRRFRVAGDWYVYARVLARGRVGFVADALNNHRRHARSVTLGEMNLAQLKEIIGMQRWIAAEVDVPGEVRERARCYAQVLYDQFGLASGPHARWSDHPELADAEGS